MMELALFAKSLSEKLSAFGLNCPYGYNGYQYILSSKKDLPEVKCVIRGMCSNYKILDNERNGWVVIWVGY